MSLTSSPTTLTGDTKWVSESKADLGYTYNMFGLSNAATRMFTTALQYNKVNVNAQYGLAHALFSLAQSKGRISSNLKTAVQLVLGALKAEPEYIPALILNLRIKSLIRGLTDTQIEHHFSSILKKAGAKGYVNALVYRDLAIIQMGRREYEGKFGAITLLNSSLETEATSQSHFLLGKAVYGSWLRNTESNESKESMLAQVKSCHSKAMSMSHNCRADITVELARIEEEMGDLETAYQLYKLTLVSEDVSIQECAYRRLSFLEKGEVAQEAYMREAMRLSHLVRITPDERMEFWDLVYRHAETIIQEKSTTHAFPWITALSGAQHPKADLLVEMYDKEHHSNPIKGGETGTCTDKKSGAAASRKQSKSISKLV